MARNKRRHELLIEFIEHLNLDDPRVPKAPCEQINCHKRLQNILDYHTEVIGSTHTAIIVIVDEHMSLIHQFVDLVHHFGLIW